MMAKNVVVPLDELFESSGFSNATCGKCGKRFGWTGRLSEKPPCPKCGAHQEPKRKASPSQRGLFDGLDEDDPQAWAHL